MADQIHREILPYIQAYPALTGRFWSKVDRRGPSECWDWKGGSVRRYGRFKVSSTEVRHSNRVAWALANNAEPGDMLVRHSCDRPQCCNPAHLSLGTFEDNMADKVARGRCRTGRQDGENNGAARLTTAQIGEIVDLFQKHWPNNAIAALYPVSHSLISRIRTGRSWQKQAAAFGWHPALPTPLTPGAAA